MSSDHDSSIGKVIFLSPEAKLAIDEIMIRSGSLTIQTAIQRAISDELFLLRHKSEGWSVKLQNGQIQRDVYWPEDLTAPRADKLRMLKRAPIKTLRNSL